VHQNLAVLLHGTADISQDDDRSRLDAPRFVAEQYQFGAKAQVLAEGQVKIQLVSPARVETACFSFGWGPFQRFDEPVDRLDLLRGEVRKILLPEQLAWAVGGF
jgi:hypothetical protein